MNLQIIVWYRYVQNNEQEKDFELFNVNCLGVHDGFRIIEEKYFTSRSHIPFKYAINVRPQVWFTPFSVNPKDPKYDEPIANLFKEY